MLGPLWNAARLTKYQRMLSTPLLGLFVSYAEEGLLEINWELWKRVQRLLVMLQCNDNNGLQFHPRKAPIDCNG